MTRVLSLDALAWPAARLGEAIPVLARAGSLEPRDADLPAPPEEILELEAGELGRWIERASSWLDLEAEAVESPYAEVLQLVRRSGPALLVFPEAPLRFLAVVRSSRGSVTVIDPEHVPRKVPVARVRRLLCRDLEERMHPVLEPLMEEAKVPPRTRERVLEAILRERIGGKAIRGGWILRARPGSSFWKQCRRIAVLRRGAGFLGAHAFAHGLWLASWWTIGRGALTGRFEIGWLVAWVLLLLTLVPFRLLAASTGGKLVIDLGALLKQRLLAGALSLEPDDIRKAGPGQLLGRVMEAEVVETLAVGGGLRTFVSLVELVMAAGVLSLGAQGPIHAFWLLIWTVGSGILGWLYVRRRDDWTVSRITMTNDLVERIVGHRTRLAQQRRDRWHDGEDEAMERYLVSSRGLDRAQLLLASLVSRGWLVVGLVAAAPVVLTGRATPASLAISLGGILLAQRALDALVAGFLQLAGAWIAWQQIGSLYEAGERTEPALPTPESSPEDEPVLLEASHLVFRYPSRPEPVLRDVSLRVGHGDRLLIEGPSGSGKSTLASVMAGLRPPEHGLLLLGGLDRHSLGMEGWRRRVVIAPQFHENYVLSGTLSFNLLMGRRWPPEDDDLEEAESVCRALGLEGLLDRMPSGLLQPVGDTGWQLSHGEKSRLYIARAILQGAHLVILDESLAALDPETLGRVLEWLLARGHALAVIAHP